MDGAELSQWDRDRLGPFIGYLPQDIELFDGSVADEHGFVAMGGSAESLSQQLSEHWREGLEAIGYLDPANPKKLMPRIQALFARSRLQKEEIDLLRGIAKQMLLRK